MKFIGRAVVDFLLYDWLDATSLTKLSRFAEHNRETFDAVLDLSARLADDHFHVVSAIGIAISSFICSCLGCQR